MDVGYMKGLTAAQVEASRREHGANVLTPPAREPMWKKFLATFKDPLIVILLVAGVLSVLIACYEYWYLEQGAGVFFEPIGIFAAILLATGVGFICEAKAEKEFSILNQVNDDEPVKVIRDGNPQSVPRRDVVVGDTVVLAQGDEIPADGTLMEAVTMTVDESSLTGEPLCHKTTNPEGFDPDATYPSNHVLRGTNVMEGHGVMVVDKVGDSTENGKVMVDAQIDDSVETPLDEQLDRLGKLVSLASYVIGGLVIAGRCLMYYLAPGFESFWSVDFGTYFLQTVMIAVTLVVVSVPEGMPMAVTMSLAFSMRRMLKTNNLVRKLHACETMGATTVICTDKTGTLTQNRMQVAEARFFGVPADLDSSEDARLIAEGMAVNATASLDLGGDTPHVIGNPTEGALLLWLRSKGLDYAAIKERAKTLAELPFSTERKYMATIVSSGVNGKTVLYVKGAPEIVMDLCGSIAGGVSRDEIERTLVKYQEEGMRTLGFASAKLGDDIEGVIKDGRVNCPKLVFRGIVAISDPVRADVPAAVRECMDAGIAIKIVTGDTPRTAREIGRQIGLWNDTDTDANMVTGPEFAAMSDRELLDRIDDVKIISRARPADKRRLGETLQAKNHVVAVTGDGTNDAPALHQAHVGLSMGDGTAVAKEASDITIIDNSFASIGRAVMWGRSLYLNIQRFVLFQLTVNVAACLIVLAGAFMGTESPLTVTQMLWVNLIMDTFAAMALASLPPSAAVMKEKPRSRTAFIISPSMWRFIVGVGGIFFLSLLGLLYVLEHADVTSLWSFLRHPVLDDYDGLTPYELSLFFTIFVFLQFWNMFNARGFATGRSALHVSDCRGFDLIMLAILVGQVLIVEVGNEFFNVVPLKLSDWVVIVAGTSVVLWIGELLRLVHKKK